MKSGKEPSLWPAALLGILVYVLSLFTSKRNQPGESVRPRDSAGEAGSYGRKDVAPVSQVVPSPPKQPKTKTACRPDQSPWWKTLFEGIAVLVAIGLLYFNFRQARATERANENARTALTVSEQASVTIGRPDGTVAEIVWPKEPKDKAGILVYFQNTGHLPAKFNWGSDSPVIAVLPDDPKAIKEPYRPGGVWPDFKTDHFFQPMWRAKRRSVPVGGEGFAWSGTITIAGGSAYQGILWEIPVNECFNLRSGTDRSCPAENLITVMVSDVTSVGDSNSRMLANLTIGCSWLLKTNARLGKCRFCAPIPVLNISALVSRQKDGRN